MLPVPAQYALRFFDNLGPQGWVWKPYPHSECDPEERGSLRPPSGGYGIYFLDSDDQTLHDSRSRALQRWAVMDSIQGEREVQDEARILARAFDLVCNDGGVEHFFEQIADEVEAYAQRRHLVISRYATASDRWLLQFRHPAGDCAWIGLNRDDATTLHIDAHWRIMHFNKFHAMSDRYDEGNRLGHPPSDLSNRLDTYLRSILAWQEADLQVTHIQPHWCASDSPSERKAEHEAWVQENLSFPVVDEAQP